MITTYEGVLEALSPFIDPDDVRRAIRKPWMATINGEWCAWATDGRILAWVPIDPEFLPEAPNVTNLSPPGIEKIVERWSMDRAERIAKAVPAPLTIDCDECFSMPRNMPTCPSCRGKGKLMDWRAARVYKGQPFAEKYLCKIGEARIAAIKLHWPSGYLCDGLRAFEMENETRGIIVAMKYTGKELAKFPKLKVKK